MARRLVALTVLVTTLTVGMAAAAWWSLRASDQSAATLPSLPEGGLQADAQADGTTTMPLTLIDVVSTLPADPVATTVAPGPAGQPTGTPPTTRAPGSPATAATAPPTTKAPGSPGTTPAAPPTSAPAGTSPPTNPPATSPPATSPPTTSPSTTLPPGARIPDDWPPGKPIPPVPDGCKQPVLEDNGVWNCQH